MMVNAQEITEIPSAGFGMESQQPHQLGEYTEGTIATIQNDKDSISKWLLSGAWNGAKINIQKEESQVNTQYIYFN